MWFTVLKNDAPSEHTCWWRIRPPLPAAWPIVWYFHTWKACLDFIDVLSHPKGVIASLPRGDIVLYLSYCFVSSKELLHKSMFYIWNDLHDTNRQRGNLRCFRCFLFYKLSITFFKYFTKNESYWRIKHESEFECQNFASLPINHFTGLLGPLVALQEGPGPPGLEPLE